LEWESAFLDAYFLTFFHATQESATLRAHSADFSDLHLWDHGMALVVRDR
jgi:hypothetical protein